MPTSVGVAMADFSVDSKSPISVEVQTAPPIEFMVDTVSPRVEVIAESVAVSMKGDKGDNGDRGERGEPGRDGKDGNDGRPGRDGRDFRYEDFTPEQLEQLRGPQGLRGESGPPGRDGTSVDVSRLMDTDTHQNIIARKSFHRGVIIGDDYGVTAESIPEMEEDGLDGQAVLSFSDPFGRAVILRGVSLPTKPGDVATKRYVDTATPLIIGTQETTTGDWTGDAPFSQLRNGQEILYWLPKSGRGNASLQLTLQGGQTTSNIPIFRMASWRVTTHYPQGSLIRMVYLNNPEGAQTGWFCNADYDANTNWQLRHNNPIRAKKNLVNRHIVVGDKDGYEHIAPGVKFDITYPIMAMTENRASGQTSGAAYLVVDGIDLRISKSGYGGQTNHMAYLVCILDGITATVAPEVIATTIPLQDTNKVYIPLGIHYSSSHIYFRSSRDMYHYRNGKVRRHSD